MATLVLFSDNVRGSVIRCLGSWRREEATPTYSYSYSHNHICDLSWKQCLCRCQSLAGGVAAAETNPTDIAELLADQLPLSLQGSLNLLKELLNPVENST